MIRPIACFFILSLSVVTGALADAQSLTIEQSPRVFVLESTALFEAKKRVENHDPRILPSYNKLVRDADHALKRPPASVMDKLNTPPSGNKHDYMSVAPYWWPNSKTHNGLPYVLQDGNVNPEREKIPDRRNLENLISAVRTLALAYFFTGEEKYEIHAVKLLQAWFIDPATRMNPNMRYAQGVPGRDHGRAAGIIETHNLPDLVDSIALLHDSKVWRHVDQRALQKWFGDYLDWLLESREGRTEANAPNNHGSWYDVQVASYALYVERKNIAERVLSELPAKRVAKQIESDGRQSHELERTNAWSYSLFNLTALITAASLGDKFGLALWNFTTDDGRSIRKALNWLLPFALGEKNWSYQEMTGSRAEKILPLLRRAAIRYRDSSYEAAISKLPNLPIDTREHLLYPNSAGITR